MATNTGKSFERLAHRIFHAIENHSRSDLESVDVMRPDTLIPAVARAQAVFLSIGLP